MFTLAKLKTTKGPPLGGGIVAEEPQEECPPKGQRGEPALILDSQPLKPQASPRFEKVIDSRREEFDLLLNLDETNKRVPDSFVSAARQDSMQSNEEQV